LFAELAIEMILSAEDSMKRLLECVLLLFDFDAIHSGTYRFLRHPNYVVVALETALLPLAFSLTVFAAIFSVANAALLFWRIRIEGRALVKSGSNALSL